MVAWNRAVSVVASVVNEDGTAASQSAPPMMSLRRFASIPNRLFRLVATAAGVVASEIVLNCVRFVSMRVRASVTLVIVEAPVTTVASNSWLPTRDQQ